jgi:hypothetical protein
VLLRKVVEYLGQVLQRAHRDYGARIKGRLIEAENARDRARLQLEKAIEAGDAKEAMPDIGLEPVDEEVHRQLEKTVDLSALTPKMPLGAALDRIRNSLDPPLAMVVLWRDLYDNAEVETTTKINMDGLSAIRLGTGLDNLLKAVSGGFGEEIGYVVDNGVLTIATVPTLPSKLETRVYQIPATLRAISVQNLVNVIMQTVDPDSWYQMNEYMGEGEIMPYVGTKLTILHTREVHVKISKLLKELGKGLPAGMGSDAPLGMLAGRLGKLKEDKESLSKQVKELTGELTELAKRQDEFQNELARERTVKGDEFKAAVGQALKKETEELVSALQTLKRRIERSAPDSAELVQIKALIVRTWMLSENVKKEVDLSSPPYYPHHRNNEESVLERRLYSQQAELSAVNYRIRHIESLMTANRVIDPEVSRIRLAARRLELAEGRVYELGVRLANLQAPRVVIVGAD